MRGGSFGARLEDGPLQEPSHPRRVQLGAQVKSPALAKLMAGDSRATGIIITLKRGQRFGTAQMNDICPQRAVEMLAIGCSQSLGWIFSKGGVFLNQQSKHLAKRGRITTQADVLVFIYDAAEERHHQGATVLNVAIDIFSGSITDHVQGWGDDQFIAPKVCPRMGKIYRDAALKQGFVESVDLR